MKTIVLISPKRRASQPAARAETAANRLANEEDRAEHRRVELEPEMEPVGDDALQDEAAAERVEGEQGRQPAARRRGIGAGPATTFGGGRDSSVVALRRRWSSQAKPADQHHADPGIGHDERAIDGGPGQAEVEEAAAIKPPDKCAQSRRERADEVVPGEDVRSPLVADDVRERRLLDRTGTARLPSRWG